MKPTLRVILLAVLVLGCLTLARAQKAKEEDHEHQEGEIHADDVDAPKDKSSKKNAKEVEPHEDDHKHEHEDEDHDDHDHEDHEDDEDKDHKDNKAEPHADEHDDEHHDDHDHEDHEDDEDKDHKHDNKAEPHADEHDDEDHDDHDHEDHEDDEDKDHKHDNKAELHADKHDDEHHDDHENHGHEGDEDHDDHDHGIHGHREDETASEHLVELYGGEGVVNEAELGVMFQELTDVCSDDDHGHAHHGHNHGHHDEESVTPKLLLENFGKDGALDAEGLEQACATILRCQLESGCELKSEHEEDDDDDDDVKGLKLIAAFVFLVEALLGSMVPLVVGHMRKFDMWLSVMNAFAGGVFLSTGFTHMLPHIQESEAEVSGLDEYPLGNVILIIGFMLVFFVEHILFNVHESMETAFTKEPVKAVTKDASLEYGATPPSMKAENENAMKPEATKDDKKWSKIANPLVLLLAISVHAILEAVAVGIEDERSGVLLLFASIASHKAVAAMALSARFVRNGATKKQVFGFMSLFSVIAPIGVFIGMASEDVSPMVHLILDGLTAGTFIYVGAYEVIADEFHGSNITSRAKQIKYVAVALGATLIALLQLIPHEDH